MPSTSLTKPNQLVTRMTTTHAMLIVLLVLNSTTTSTSSLSTPTFTGPRIVSLRPSHVSVGVKGTAIFECQVVAYPLAKISWRKNGRRVSEAASKSSKFKQTHGSNVSILRVNDVNHAMNITCVAEADSSTTSTPTVSEATAHLRTLSNDRYLPKIRITNPKSVEPDTIFKIDCNVTSPGSGATVHWYQANRPISFENPKYFSNVSWIDADSHRHSLYVRGLSLSSDPLVDSLEIDFSCLAVNTYGTSIADTSILVRNRLMPPIFIAPKRSLIELEYGSSANISCIANGMPRPRVKWLEAKPETPSDLKVATVYSNSIEIEWRQSGVTDVNYYVVKYRKYPLDNELALEVDELDEEVNLDSTESDDFNLSEYYYKRVNSTLTKVKIGSNLTAYTLYEFRVAAVNALGSSDETEPILVRTAATKPGLVKNMRYVQKNDDTYLIKCDEPDEPNGNINSFMIYYTDQVTNPLKSWMSVNVPAAEMPYELKLKPKSARRTRQSPLSNSIAERSFFIRISAVNLEMGEGPYSNIIQLKRINHRFEAPMDLIVKQVNSTEALLKWSYKTSSLESIYRQLSGDQPDVDIEPEDLIKNLYFELYIIKKASNLSETSRTMPRFPSMSAFRTIEAIDSALVDSITSTNSKPTASSSIVFRAKSSQRQRNIKKRSSPAGSHSIQFEFTLDNLVPSTLYSIEMAPRLFLMEGLNSRTIRFTTQHLLITKIELLEGLFYNYKRANIG